MAVKRRRVMKPGSYKRKFVTRPLNKYSQGSYRVRRSSTRSVQRRLTPRMSRRRTGRVRGKAFKHASGRGATKSVYSDRGFNRPGIRRIKSLRSGMRRMSGVRTRRRSAGLRRRGTT
jgi:hypothetical protein